jgi:hypothetical protein
VTGWWFSLISSTNKTDCHEITEILLKVALNTKFIIPILAMPYIEPSYQTYPFPKIDFSSIEENPGIYVSTKKKMFPSLKPRK